MSADSAATAHTTSVLGLLAEKGGITITDTIPIASKDPQSAYTPVIQKMKADGDNYNLTGAPVDNVISMRQEAQLQGLTDPKFVWTCQVQCYDKKTVDAGDVMANTKIVMNFLPNLPAEAKSNATLKNFVKYVGADKASGFAVWGWVSTLLFQQAANQVVKDAGCQRPDARQSLGRAEEHALVRRRRHVGEDGSGCQGELAVLHDHDVRRQEVRAGVPEEGGNVRLHRVEPPERGLRGQRLIPAEL